MSPRSGPSSVALGERKDLAPVPVASHPCSVRAQGRVGQVDSASLSDRRALCRRRLSRGACFLPGPASRCPAAEPNPASPISNRARLSFSLVGAGALVVVACLETCGRTPEAARRKVPSHCGRCGAELALRSRVVKLRLSARDRPDLLSRLFSFFAGNLKLAGTNPPPFFFFFPGFASRNACFYTGA